MGLKGTIPAEVGYLNFLINVRLAANIVFMAISLMNFVVCTNCNHSICSLTSNMRVMAFYHPVKQRSWQYSSSTGETFRLEGMNQDSFFRIGRDSFRRSELSKLVSSLTQTTSWLKTGHKESHSVAGLASLAAVTKG
ncbi:hypothetical protein RJ640_023732 [Escallonia rubra]|uniref:Uncharacterized protein n=1 Tax=Escallonia rubra TaxID=112253 RepID=A0AA88R1H8_9ASTE|nr:hypothetical protein RJ640_023732 [Escallonia rubra]